MQQIKIMLLFIGLIFIHKGFSQDIHGQVYELDASDLKAPLAGVNIYWAGTDVGTASDADGHFHLDRHGDNSSLVFSFIGYKKDTLELQEGEEMLEIVLSVNNSLKEVVVTDKVAGSHISRTDPILTQNITKGELQKAACCNLSESFETNASVDVAYSDAVSGAKQIKLLGLSGKYSQVLTENIPNLRGLGTSFGFAYVPGSWMESIQVSKGTASVKNGYESITGQINIEFKKPDDREIFFLNAYANSLGKVEGNINGAISLTERWSTALFAHAESNSYKIDKNGDSFLDIPLITQYHFFNRWKFDGENYNLQFGLKYLNEDRTGGQLDFDKNKERTVENPYGTNINTDRVEFFAKTARFFKRPNTNMGFINSFIYHDMSSYFGLTDYDAKEWNYYGNLMFQSYISNTSHTYTTGVSYLYDQYREVLNDSAFSRVEHVPGAFFEYTYVKPGKLTLLLGMRADHHNLYGMLYSPRIHFKLDLTKKTVLRTSVGKGYRTPNVLAENISLLASSRKIAWTEELKMEESWNYGINITQYADILGRELSINVEFYRTYFINQAIIDKEKDNSTIYIYNLDGESYANNFQVEAKYELLPRLDLVAAFRINDVKMTINNELMREALVHKYKGLLVLSYATRMKKWQFDFTAQFNGPGRIPSTEGNPDQYRRPDKSPSYTILNTQVTKYFKRWELYLGGENLTNFTQDDPIIASDDPFSEYFDASDIWGPLVGIRIYAGLRFAINKDK